MKLAIVGSRDWKRPEYVRDLVRALNGLRDVVVSGRGGIVDKTAERVANDRQIATQIFPAEWERLGKRAGFIRNQLIVDNCDAVVAFWDGASKGTEDTIAKAKKAGKPVIIIGDAHRLEHDDIIEIIQGIRQEVHYV